MKKISIILAALAACFAISCTKEAPTTEPQDPSAPAGMKKVTITATAEGATKTTYTDNGEFGVFSWTEGDQISVWCSDDQFHTLTAEAEGASVRFSGMIPEGVSLGWYAFYPADENHANCAFSIPQYKDLSKQFSADLPMGAQIVDGAYVFKHMTSAIELTFSNIPDEVKTVVISFVNESMKFSGSFSSYISNDRWIWNTIEEGVQESDRTYIRKVSVENNTAKLYVPYRGKLWGGYDNTINIIGFDEDGNEYVLLRDRNMPGRDLDLTGQGIIVPVASLELPDYVPSVDWTKVDWTGENVLSYVLPAYGVSSSRQVLREMQYFADVHYLYLRLSASIAKLTETSTEKLTFAFFDKTDGAGAGLWGWWGDAKGDIQYVAEGIAPITGTDLDVSISTGVNKQEDGDMVIWTFAIPRSTHEVFQNSAVYLGIMSQKGSDATGAIPEKYASMLEVTLP